MPDVTVRDVRLLAAELIEREGWTRDIIQGPPYNTFRAIETAARQVGVRLRRAALSEVRDELGVDSIFLWEQESGRPLVDVLAALRGVALHQREVAAHG